MGRESSPGRGALDEDGVEPQWYGKLRVKVPERHWDRTPGRRDRRVTEEVFPKTRQESRRLTWKGDVRSGPLW